MPVPETILVIMGLLSIAMVATALCRNLPIPFTVFLVLLGMLLAAAADSVPALAPLREFQLTPDLVFFVFLPALIFESALNLDARQLLKDLAPIMALAVPAMLISTAIIGVGFWAYTDLGLAIALLFGALISATDPVAVVGLFKELGAPARLTILVEGESLFNDATAIVMFHILLGIALAGSFEFGDFGHAVMSFFRVFFGGVIVGVVIGFGIAELMRRIRSSELAILVMSLVMAYASFVIAEHVLHVSGVMAALSAAVAMGLYGVTRIPNTALELIHETWEVIALICNSLLFLMIGLTVDLGTLIGSIDGILVGAVLVLVARAISVYTLVPATTRLFALPKVSMGERHIMWWGGLKGGLAIAIVMSIPEELTGRQTLIELTLGVVLCTLLLNAPTIRPLIRRLGIDRMTEDEQAGLKRGLLSSEQQAQAVLSRLEQADLLDTERRHTIGESLSDIFKKNAPAIEARRLLRHVYLEALHIEGEELERIYHIGLVHEYTYLDLRTRLRRDRESWVELGEDAKTRTQTPPVNPFKRLELLILRWMREQNWLAPLLAYFQGARLGQGVQRDIGGILCAEAVLSSLPLVPGLSHDHVTRVLEIYRQRVERKRGRVVAIRRDFPEFAESLEQNLYRRAALASARQHAEASHHHGEIGAKAFTRIERILEQAMDSVPRIVNPSSNLTAAELIERIPLFQDLSHEIIEKLAHETRAVTFLPGDVVIGESEKGNALYIITQGTVNVYKTDQAGGDVQIATLEQGDFFGEAALLGQDVRTATVKANTPLKLLRLSRRRVLALADVHQEVEARLQQANEDRR